MIQTWNTTDLRLDVDAVLRGQGADPEVIRQRRPLLVEIAEKALDQARPLLQPQAFYCQLDVTSVQHGKIKLQGGYTLQGALLSQHLSSAAYIIFMLFTIGDALENLISASIKQDPLYGLALDGVGSAAVEALANAACSFFEQQAIERGEQASIPLSPGMIGWPIEEGQPQIFSILKKAQSDVVLTKNNLMLPRKSLSMVQGFGSDMKLAGHICDFCSMRETCRYQNHYQPSTNS